MRVIHLIRHAAPALQGVILGQANPPLAAEVLEPSRLIVATVVASPLLRARRTAELLFPTHPITTLPELSEAAAGEWEGLTWSEIQSRWPALAARKETDWYCVPAPGGESWTAFVERVRRAWAAIRMVPSPVAVVAHAGVNAVLAYTIAGQDPNAFHQRYCEALTYDVPD